jgi:hypothetical protein
MELSEAEEGLDDEQDECRWKKGKCLPNDSGRAEENIGWPRRIGRSFV